MAGEQSVIFKGHKEGISIWLDEQAEFEQICQQLQKKVSNAKHFFAGANANVSFKGREITEEDEKTLLDIIASETTLDISFVEHEEVDPPPESTALVTIPEPEPELEPADILPAKKRAQYTEHMTAYYRTGLRSGQSIRYQGSVVVAGDANPGSEIVANGNVVVLGSLKGMVHAGAGGDDRCFVSALVFMPTQLRIANIITYIPTADNEIRRAQIRKPSYAYIQDGQVYIAPLCD